MNRVPREIRQTLKERLWQKADELGWISLSSTDKTAHYEMWSRSDDFVRPLKGFVPSQDVRVYIKDSLMKGYQRARTASPKLVREVFNLESTTIIEEEVKPHSIELDDGRMYAWGMATEWRTILLALFERAWRGEGTPVGVVLLNATGQYRQPADRQLVEDVADLLGIETVKWYEGSIYDKF